MKQIFPFIFMLLFLGILVGANIYLSKRFAWYFSVGHTWPLHLGFAMLVVLMTIGVAAFTNATGIVGHLIYITGATLMGLLLYLLLSVVLIDLLGLVVKVRPMHYGFTVLFLTITVCVYGILNAFQIRTREIEVEIPGLKQEVRAMHLTDIHLGHFRGPVFLQKLVEMTNKQNVDMVLITGDLYDGKIRFCDVCLDPLMALNAPVYFVEGNHDGYSGVERVKSGLRKVGVHVLSNEMAVQGEIQIIGLNHMSADENNVNMHANGHRATISSILPGIPSDSRKTHHPASSQSPWNRVCAAEGGGPLPLGTYPCGSAFPGKLYWKFNLSIQ